MYVDHHPSAPTSLSKDQAPKDQATELRLELLIQRLPERLQRATRRLRQPSARWMRIPLGTLLILGGVFSILPVLGLWMLPFGMVLLAEDIPLLRRPIDHVLYRIEQHRPHWLGLPRRANPVGRGSST